MGKPRSGRRSDKLCGKREESVDNTLYSRAAALAVIVLCVSAAFSNAVSAAFTYDDYAALVYNEDVTSTRSMWRALCDILTHDYWGMPLHSSESHHSYRPLTTLTFLLEARVQRWWTGARALSPLSFHCTNVALHCVCSFLVCSLMQRLLDVLWGEKQAEDAPKSARVMLEQQSPLARLWGSSPVSLGAIVSGALFAVHPVHVEAVTSIVGRAELLSALCVLLSLLFFPFGQVGGKDAVKVRLLCALFHCAAALCKESSIAVIPVVLLVDMLCCWRQGKRIWSTTSGVLSYALPLVFFVVVRVAVVGSIGPSPRFSAVHNALLNSDSMLERIATSFYLFAYYLFLLFFPLRLSADYSAHCMPVVTASLSVEFLWSVSAFVALAAAMAHVLITILRPHSLLHGSKRAQLGVLCSFSFLSTFVCLTPVLHVLFVASTVIAERTLYLPSVAMMLLLGALHFVSTHAARYARSSTLRTCAKWFARSAMLLLVLWGARSVARNHDWRDNVALFSSALDVCPSSAKAHHLYALALLRAFEHEDDAQLSAHTREHDLAAAEHHLEKALQLFPSYSAPLYRMGTVYASRALSNRHDEERFAAYAATAVEWFSRAIEVQAQYAADAHSFIAILSSMREMENPGTSLRHFEAAIALNENNAAFRANLGNFLWQLGRQEEALRRYLEAVDLDPENVQFRVSAAGAYGGLGELHRAIELLQAAVAIDPSNAMAQDMLYAMMDAT